MRAAPEMDIVQVAKTLGLQAHSTGSAHYCRCPVTGHEHDDQNPRCQLGGEKVHLWHCHKCGQSGDAVGLVKGVRGCDAGEAFKGLRSEEELRGWFGDRRVALSGLCRAIGVAHASDTSQLHGKPVILRLTRKRGSEDKPYADYSACSESDRRACEQAVARTGQNLGGESGGKQ